MLTRMRKHACACIRIGSTLVMRIGIFTNHLSLSSFFKYFIGVIVSIREERSSLGNISRLYRLRVCDPT